MRVLLRRLQQLSAVGFRTTGKALLDLNFAVASLRSASEHDISQRFTKAFFEDKLMAMKWLFATCAGHILISKAGNVDGCC